MPSATSPILAYSILPLNTPVARGEVPSVSEVERGQLLS